MYNNFRHYFNCSPEKNVDWGWHNDAYHVAFAGGETASGETAKIAVIKASLLTPYLWDSKFDWVTGYKNDIGDHRILSVLNHLQQRKSDA